MCFLWGSHTSDGRRVTETLRQRRELTPEQWKAVLGDLRRTGLRNLVFSGGEVFLKEGFLDILESARDEGFTFAVLTNGSRVTERNVDRFVRARPAYVRLSLEGDRETHDRIAGRRCFDTILATIDLIRSAKEGPPGLAFETVIQRANQSVLHSVVEVARDKGVGHVVMSNIFFTPPRAPVTGQPTREIFEELRQVDVDVVTRELELVRELCGRYGIALTCRMRSREDVRNIYYDPTFAFLNRCLYPWISARINPYGDVIPCTGSCLGMGNVLERNFADIWNGERFVRFRRDLRKCGLFPECVKCNTLSEDRWAHWNEVRA